jgi:hypothetical protein
MRGEAVRWLRNFNQAITEDPGLWVVDSFIVAILTGFSLWSWKASAVAGLVLLGFLCIRALRVWYPLPWAGCWTLVWCTFVQSIISNLARHPDLVSKVIIWAIALVAGYFLYLWTGRPIALGVIEDKPQTPGGLGVNDGPYQQARPESKSEVSVPAGSEEIFDPYSLLGVSRGASFGEIKQSYRREMSLYHPDKVEHLGAELKKAAAKRTLEITRAFEMLAAQHSEAVV